MNPLRAFLPESVVPGGWTKDGDFQYFPGEDLYIYIDGGAEIYLEYGFAGVIVQDYKDSGGSRISLEVFEMRSSEAAYGMLTFKKGPQGEMIALGDRGQMDDYYLNFCKGPYVVTITSLDLAETAKDGVLAIGRAVAKLIRETAAEPGIVARLPREGLRPRSIKYFRGRLGVSNSLPFLAKTAAGITDGVMADYYSGRTVCVFQYPDKELALKRLGEALAGIPEKRQAVHGGVGGPVLIGRDDKGRSYFAQLKDDLIVFVSGDLDLLKAGEDLARVLAGLKPLVH